MKFLLDTHIWIWSQGVANRLSRRVQRVVSDPRNELWLSPVSIVEFHALSHKKRFKIHSDLETWLPTALAGLHEATVTNEVALATGRYLALLTDPADRIIAATASVYGLRLITADAALAELPDIEVLAND